MITIQSEVRVERIGSMPIFNFLLNPSDSAYQRWWPGTHLQFHTLRKSPGSASSVVYMDEYIGARRLRLTGIVLEADPGRKIIWQFRKVIRLPAWLVCPAVRGASTGLKMRKKIVRASFVGILSASE